MNFSVYMNINNRKVLYTVKFFVSKEDAYPSIIIIKLIISLIAYTIFASI